MVKKIRPESVLNRIVRREEEPEAQCHTSFIDDEQRMGVRWETHSRDNDQPSFPFDCNYVSLEVRIFDVNGESFFIDLHTSSSNAGELLETAKKEERKLANLIASLQAAHEAWADKVADMAVAMSEKPSK